MVFMQMYLKKGKRVVIKQEKNLRRFTKTKKMQMIIWSIMIEKGGG